MIANHGNKEEIFVLTRINKWGLKKTGRMQLEQYIILWKMRLILSFCGGAYLKFGINSE